MKKTRAELAKDFPELVATMAVEYPYKVEMPLNRGFNTHIAWLDENSITEYDHYSYKPTDGSVAMNAMCFKREEDAVLYSLKWL